jgi:pimeloyl-ACP methyl ester carboxylesterase
VARSEDVAPAGPAASPREGWLQVTAGISLHYRSYGQRSAATPVICLPGYWRTSRDFEELAARLACDRQVITVDLRGRGRSGRSDDPDDYRFERLADDVVKLLDALDCPRAVFVGLALGAQLSLHLAASLPDRVAGIVLNDSGPESNPMAGARMKRFSGDDEITHEEALRRVKAQYAEDFPRLTGQDFERLVYRNYRRSDAGGYVRERIRSRLRPAHQPRPGPDEDGAAGFLA